MQYIIKFAFSKYSSRNSVPKILEQGRFTHNGFKILGTNRRDSINFQPRRQSRISRNNIVGDIANAHLYYSHEQDIKARLQKLWDKRRERQRLFQNAPPIEEVLGYIKDKDNLERGNWRLLFGLKLLHKHYQPQLEENMEHILYALNRANQYLHTFDIHNFRSLVSFASRYQRDDKDLWKSYLSNTIRFIVSYEQRQQPLLSAAVKEDVRDDFLLAFHQVVNKALHFKFPLDYLIEQVDIMLRNHYRLTGNTDQTTFNKFAHLKADQAALFLGDFINIIIQRKDFYNEYDQNVKVNQVKDLLREGLKTFDRTSLQQKSLAYVDASLKKLKGTVYEL